MRRRGLFIGLLLGWLSAACQGEDSSPGSLTVESVPPGADLLVDGKPVGRTPYTIEAPVAATTKDRSVQLDLTHPERLTWRRTVVLHAHSSQTLTVFLPERTGGAAADGEDFVVEELTLVVKATEGWKVEVDGRPATASSSGYASLVAAGTHTLALKNDQGEEHTYRVRVSAPGPAEVQILEPGVEADGNISASNLEYLGCEGCEQQKRRTARPERAPKADLAINTKPPARVIIDGEDTGRRTPIWPSQPLRLAHGAHDISFQTSGGEIFTYRIWVDHERVSNKLIIKKLGGRHSGNVRGEYVGRRR